MHRSTSGSEGDRSEQDDRRLVAGDLRRSHGSEDFPQRPVPGRPALVSVADLSLACARMPRAVVCLETAAYLLGLVDRVPTQTWLAIPQGSRALREYEQRWHVIYWSNARAFRVGVAFDRRTGAAIRMTSCVRTVVDLVRCSRYLRGLEPARHAARRYVAAGNDASTLLTMAEELRSSIGTMRNVQLLIDALESEVQTP